MSVNDQDASAAQPARDTYAALQAERQRLHDVLEMLPAYAILLSPDYHVPFANRFFRERFGESRGRRCYEYLFHREQPCETCETYTVLKTKAPHRWEWSGPDGRNYDIHDFPFNDSDGSPLILEVGLDITDRKKAEAEVTKSRDRLADLVSERTTELQATTRKFAAMFANTSDGVWLHNLQGEILEVNDAYCRMSGYSREALTRMPISTLEASESAEEVARHIRKVLEGGGHDRFESRHRRKDGSIFDVDITALQLDIDGGRIAVFVRDITQRKRAEERIRQGEKELRLVMDTVPALIAYVDPEFRYRRVNQTYERWFGLAPREMEGRHIPDVLGEEAWERIRSHMERAMAGETVTYEEEMPYRLGRPRWVAATLVPDCDAAGRVQGVVAHITDITGRKQAEERLRQSEEGMAELYHEARLEIAQRERVEAELRRSNADLEQFAFAISHDLRSPLNAITSFSQQLQEDFHEKLGADADIYLAYITGASARMRRLITDLLTYSRVAETDEGKPAVRDSEKALEAAELNLQEKVREAGAVITHDPLPEVATVLGLLTEVFQNLIENAIKFRGDAAPRIHVSAEPREAEWLFCVSDNGIGIEPRHAEQVFRIFKRLHGDTYEGTGIGLAVCKKIVERQGGRIWVESALGQGASVYFTLPAPS